MKSDYELLAEAIMDRNLTLPKSPVEIRHIADPEQWQFRWNGLPISSHETLEETQEAAAKYQASRK
jgi:hypothetical protein